MNSLHVTSKVTYMYVYSETNNSGLSERRSTSVQRTNSMPLIALPIEIVHLETLRSGHLSVKILLIQLLVGHSPLSEAINKLKIGGVAS